MITLVIDEHIPFIKGVLEPFARVIYARGGMIDRKAALEADGLIIRTRTRCDARLLEGTPVKLIATATIGFDHIDTEYCDSKGIKWFHAPGCNSGSVKQYIASVLASLQINHGFDLRGKKTGIVGAGHVGSKVAGLAGILGMTPLLNDPPRARIEGDGNFVSLEEIMETADIITFHVPLIHNGADKTFHLADREFFYKLLRKPFIINTSRGQVVETNAVKEAVRNGAIAGYIADVWENEPFIDQELLDWSILGTPHIAGYSVEGKANGTAACVRAASRYFGFGLENWFPPALPQSLNTVIQLDAKIKTNDQLVAEAILSTYDVREDDQDLKKDPSQFEQLRNHYHIRREFEAFKIPGNNLNLELIDFLSGLGFTLI